MEQKQITVVDIKKFLEFQSTPVQMTEMQAFWKALSDAEKDGFRTEVGRWDGQSKFIN